MNLMVSSKPSLRHVLILPGVLLLVAWPAASQQVARVEAFFGYAFARVRRGGSRAFLQRQRRQCAVPV